MHAYRRLVQAEMDAEGWTQSELADKAKLDRQIINKIVLDDRKRLTHPPSEKTVHGLATAFNLPDDAVWGAVAEAMGLPRSAAPAITHEVKGVSHAVLLTELASRLGLEISVRTTESEAPAKAGKGKKTRGLTATDEQSPKSMTTPAKEADPERR